MDIRSLVPLGPKTTMRIGGSARCFTELKTKKDVEQATAFSCEHHAPLIVLGGGSNTVFADGVIEALVVRIQASEMYVEGNTVTVEAGKNLAMLINELALRGLDLSPLTGIPGTLGGAIFGNAGGGPKGIWIDQYVKSVTAFVDGVWKTFLKEECGFRYRESGFKDSIDMRHEMRDIRGKHTQVSSLKPQAPPIIWETTLRIPSGDPAAINNEVERLLQKRIETQPHLKTAGSCFKAVGDVPAWQLIDKAGLRGYKIGDVQIAEKHANFLLNKGIATFADTKKLVEEVQEKIPEKLEVEMRFFEKDGTLTF